jgi:tRNA (adenine22-N1)-methyltransferase
MDQSVKLSRRLEAVAGFFVPGRSFADIGTDHAGLPIVLVERGIFEKAVAADVRKGPLQTAAAHIAAAGLTDRIEAVLSDGLDAIGPERAEAVCMAGMGGYLIAELLERASAQDRLKMTSQLVLQPQSETDRVRRQIHAIGFRIERERMEEDRGKLYTVIRAVPGSEQYEDAEYRFGKCLFADRDPVFHKLLKRIEVRNRSVLERLKDGSDADRLREELDQAERMLNSWNAQSV